MLVSGSQLLLLDPQKRYLAGVDNPSVAPGVSLAFGAEHPGTMDDFFAAFRSDEGGRGRGRAAARNPLQFSVS
jgi:hypothetical protein